MDYLKLFQTHQEYEAFVSGGTMLRPNVSHCVNEKEVHYNPIPIMTVRYNVTDASNPTQLYTYLTEGGITVNGAAMFDKAMIDGVEVSIADLDAASGQTQFSVGEHTVKYTLKDPTFIGFEVDEETGMPTKIGAVFMQCTSVVSIEIPNSVATIGNIAFINCSSLTSVTIGSSVTSIGNSAFFECSGLTSVTIGNSVTSIDGYVFNGCIHLANVTIGNSVTSIGKWAFFECSGLTSVTIEATTPPTLDERVFDKNASGRKIYVPSESVNAYKTANGWSAYAVDIEPIQ